MSNILRRIIDPWVVLGAVAFACSLLAASLSLFWVLRPAPQPAGLPTAALTVVAMPTDTPQPATPTATAPLTPSPSPLPLPPPGEFEVGAYVQIFGTGGDGLRLRIEPSLESQVRFLGLEAEVFQVREGPREVDGHIWWYLAAPLDETRGGWAVANYLSVVQNP